MKLCLIITLCLSMGFCDKLDRTYLPPEGSRQSSGDPDELELPYEDFKSKGKDYGLQQTQDIDPTKYNSFAKLKNANDNNSHEFQNNPNLEDGSSKEKLMSVDDFGKNYEQSNVPMYNNRHKPFANSEQFLDRSNMDLNDSVKHMELNPYLPLQEQAYPASISRFEKISSPGQSNSLNTNNKNNIVEIGQIPSNEQNINLHNNMPYKDLSGNASTFPIGNFERKSEIEIVDSSINRDKTSEGNNIHISDPEVSKQEGQRFKTTGGVYNNTSSSNKDNKSAQTRPSRPQASYDRNAEIINYENSISPEDGKFAFSFDTSNGIHVDEHGTANDGVKAEGGFSYTGDDGKVYTIRYTADENGFQPTGDHLPTPPPIPQAILRVIELAIKNKENGVSEDSGMYDDNKYGYQNYDRGFVAKMKKPQSIIPLESIDYESVPEGGETLTKIQLNSTGDKETDYEHSDIVTIKSIDASENLNFGRLKNKITEDAPNVYHENIRKSSTKVRPQMPTFTRNIVQNPPLFAQTMFDDNSKIDVVPKVQEGRRPLGINSRTSINRQLEAANEGKAKESIPVTDPRQENLYNLNSANKLQPQMSLVRDNNFDKEKSRFKSQPSVNDIMSLQQNNENSGLNAMKIAEVYDFSSSQPNTKINENNPRKDVFKVMYDTEAMTGYGYPAPTRAFFMNPNFHDTSSDSQQDTEISDSKPQLFMLQASKTRRPVNIENNKPEKEKIEKLRTIRPEINTRPATKEYSTPIVNNNKNRGQTVKKLQTSTYLEIAPVKLVESPIIDSNYSERSPIKGDNIDDVYLKKSQSANEGNRKISGGQDFRGPQQKPYFDPETGYHY